MAKKELLIENETNKYIVQKSRPLFSLWQSNLTLAEFKILDTYLAKINSKKPDERLVVFDKGELEKLLGVKRIKIDELDKRLKNLMTTVRIDDSTVKRGFTRISLFEKAFAEQDEYGLWKVEMMCTQSAMKYIFNIENLGYLRYKLRCITFISSRYTYILFMYLESNRFRKKWIIKLEDLKKILNCEEEYAKEFKYFNRDVLKKVQEEMHKKTECKFSYRTIKKGRSVTAIEFELEPLAKIKAEVKETEPKLEPLELEDLKEEVKTNKELWEIAIEDFNFKKEQIEELRQILIVIPNHMLPQSPVCQDNIELMRFHYMQIKTKEIERRDREKPIKNKFAYLLKILKQDLKNS